MDGEIVTRDSCLVTRTPESAAGGPFIARAGTSDGSRATGHLAWSILEAMTPPATTTPRGDYRPYVTAQAGAMSFDDLRTLCAFFRCSVTRVVTRIMDHQYARARVRSVPVRAYLPGDTTAKPSREKTTPPGVTTNESLSSFSAFRTEGGAPLASGPALAEDLRSQISDLKSSVPPVELPVRGGGTVLVDADVARRLAGKTIGRRGRGYFCVSIDGQHLYLHHVVAGHIKGRDVDHKNRDKADNRLCNLRLVTCSVNNLNSVRRPGPSGFRGVRAEQCGRGWRADFTWDRRRRSEGTYGSPLLGAMARDDLVVQTTGLREGLNFPESVAAEVLPALLDELGGQPFEVWFVKRSDGSIRHMVCQDPAPDPAERPLAFDPVERGLRPVWDVEAQAHRFLPLEGVLCLSCNGTRYRVLPSKNPSRPSTSTETWCVRAAGWLTSPLTGCSSCPAGQPANAAVCLSS